MNENRLNTVIKKFIAIAAIAFLLCACGGGNEEAKEALEFDPDHIYEPPAMAPVSFDKDKAVANDEVVFDLSHTAEGYFSISVVSNEKLKMRVIKNDSEEYYDYDLNNDGTVCYYPLQMGNGSYMLVVYKNIEDTKYATKSVIILGLYWNMSWGESLVKRNISGWKKAFVLQRK